MDFTLHVWRQPGPDAPGKMVTYEVKYISPDSSFFEMMDHLNFQLIEKGEEAIAYDSDCLEGICGTCSLMINGIAHGPEAGTTTCQLHMRSFKDGDHIYIEPWRAKPFPIVRDLVVDRSAFDRIIQAGGFVSVNTGGTPDANALPISKEEADRSMDAAQCIGCGACVAACKNASAMLFVGAKVGQFAHLPQGHAERTRRVLNMVDVMDKEGFGNCTNYHECEAVCPKEISVEFISEMNKEYLRASVVSR